MKYLVILMSLFFMSSCASIVDGQKQSILISSDPAGANVNITKDANEVHKGLTPSMVTLDRGEGDHVVEVSKDGYKTQILQLADTVSGWMWGNIVFGGLIGWAIDYGTGAGYNYNVEDTPSHNNTAKKGNIHVNLEEEE